MTNVRKVPRLRFPEFRDAGNWEEKRLEDFAVIVRGGSPRPIDEFITNDTNGLNWLKIGDIDKESKFVTHTGKGYSCRLDQNTSGQPRRFDTFKLDELWSSIYSGNQNLHP